MAGRRYVYGFGVRDTEVVEEWLYSYPKGRRRILFERTRMALTYGATLSGERTAVERTIRIGDEEFVLPADAESAGTKTWLNLVTSALNSLMSGSSLWVDEIDVSLHPLLTAKLLTLFQNPELNPLGAP
ncbi:AAA family ATPase [Streptomyces sp. NPDC088341]|uniref:AAA family ATPase n=1 Tax=Streptomyces sp. NPDC088341 TaxID=3154870 RepID=UPI003414BB94